LPFASIDIAPLLSPYSRRTAYWVSPSASRARISAACPAVSFARLLNLGVRSSSPAASSHATSWSISRNVRFGLGTRTCSRFERPGLSSRILSSTASSRICAVRPIIIWMERSDSGLRRRPFLSVGRPPAFVIASSLSRSANSLARKSWQCLSLISATGIGPKKGRMYLRKRHR
jgi:hypothetical protein